MRKASFACRSVGLAAALLLTLSSAAASAQRASAVESITISGINSEAIQGTVPTGTERDAIISIEGCQALLSDLNDEITVRYDFTSIDSGAQYVVKLRRGSETCSGNTLASADDECPRVVAPRDLVAEFSVTFTVADLLGDEFDSQSDCYDTQFDATYQVLVVFQEDEDNDNSLDDDEFSVDTLNFDVNLTRPGAPSGVTVSPGESGATFKWDERSDADYYEVYVTQDVTEFEVDYPENLVPNGRRSDNNERDVGGLSVNTTYYGAVLAVDEFGNRSLLSEATEFETVPSSDFWELYRSQGGVEEGGCSAAPRSGAPAGLVFLVLAALRRRRS